MANLVLGSSPGGLTVHLGGGPFRASLRSQDAAGSAVNWPIGASLRLVVRASRAGRSWPFTIVGSTASLTIPADEVAGLPDSPLYADLWLDYGDGEFLWCTGSVVRHD